MDAYETAKKKREEELRCAADSTRSIAGRQGFPTDNDGDEDFDVSWMADVGEN